MSSLTDHWNRIYRKKSPEQVSWFQPHLLQSLELTKNAHLAKNARIIDVGGGASSLANDLLAAGFSDITVVDISSEALRLAKARLADNATRVQWLEADVLKVALPSEHYDLWHDRAVFHFLVNSDDQSAYIANMARALKTGGYFVIGGFALDGPEQCSGLPVARHSSTTLRTLLGASFARVQETSETHHTLSGVEQRFIFCSFRKQEKMEA